MTSFPRFASLAATAALAASLCLAPPARAAAPLLLQWGTIDTSGAEAQAESAALKSKLAKKAAAARKTAAAESRAAYVVQFPGPVAEEWRVWLESATQVRGYLPEFAYLVWATPSEMDAIAANENVFWTGEWKPEYKTVLAGSAADAPVRSPASASSDADAARWMHVGSLLTDDAGAADLRDRLEALGAPVRSAFPRLDGCGAVAYLTDAQIAEISSWPDVQWIEPKLQPRLFNDQAARTNMMNVSNVWKSLSSGGLGLTGAGQIVAVADTGCDKGSTTDIHDDFAGRVVAGYGWTNGAYKSSASWADLDAHGTHVAGSVLGSGAKSSGQFKGMAYEAQLVMQGCWEDLGGLPDNVQDLFKQAYNAGARIHSDSWGFGTNYAGRYVYDAVDADGYMWTNQNFLALFAAGNDGIDRNSDGVIDAGSVTPPSTAKNCICVGAAENWRSTGGYSRSKWGTAWPDDYPAAPIKTDYISETDAAQGLAAFSSRGPTQDGRFKPDIVAPGTDVISVRSRMAQDDGWGVYSANTNYIFEGGTSMATPLTSGATTLIRQWLVDRQGIANPPAALMKALLINGARDMTPGQYGTNQYQEITARPDRSQGFGHVNLYSSLEPGDGNFLVYVTNKLTSSANFTTNIAVARPNAGTYRLTLVWQDYPGSSGASKTLVNDLDLTVTSPSGNTVYYPNNLSTNDHVNNVEFIEFTAAETGTYTVKVNGYSVSKTSPHGGQPYALVMRGPETVLEDTAPEFSSSTATDTVVLGETLLFDFTSLLTAGWPSPNYSITASSAPASTYGFSSGVLTFNPAAAGTFTFTCRASNDSGWANCTLTVTVTLPPPSVPANLALTDVGTTSFTASWSAAANATSYQLDVVQGTTFEASAGDPVLSEDFSDTTGWTLYGTGQYTGSGLYGDASPAIKFDGTGDYAISPDFGSGISLEFWACGNNGSGSTFDISGLVDGDWQDIDTVTIAQGGDDYQVDLPSGTSQIRFDFTKNPVNCALDDVIVYAPTAAAGEYVPGWSNATVNATNASITGLAPSTDYAVRVRGVNADGVSDWSTTATTTTTAGDTAPSWSAFPAQTYRYGSNGGYFDFNVSSYASGSPSPALRMADTDLNAVFLEESGAFTFEPEALGTFTFTFTASNTLGVATNVLSVTVDALAPVLSPVGDQSCTVDVGVLLPLTLTGDPAPVLTVTSADAAANTYEIIDDSGTPNFLFVPSATGTYHFVFTATNIAASVSESIAVTVTDAPVTVPTLSVTNVTATSALATWTECTGVSSYTLQLASDDQFSTGGSGGSGETLTETFANASFTTTSSSYTDQTITGCSLGTWTATSCRGDLGTPVIRYGGTLTSPTIADGVAAVEFDYDWPYTESGSCDIELYVGGTLMDTATVTGGTAGTAIYTLSSPVAGPTTIEFLNKASTTKRMRINQVRITTPSSGSSGDGSLILETTVASNEYTFTGLTPETTYYARVKGTNDWSNTVQFTTAAAGDSAPVWSASFPAAATNNVGELYELANVSSYVSGSPAPAITLTAPAGVTASFEDDTFRFSPPAAQSYTFTFTASNSVGTADATLVVTGHAEAPELAASLGTSISSTVGDTVEFTVTATGIPAPASIDATCTEGAYYIFENGSFLFDSPAVGTYHFVFTATNVAGTGTLTVTVSVSPAPVTVPVLSVSDVTDTTALASWTACDNVSSYTLQLSTNDFPAAGGSARSATPILAETFDGFTPTSTTDIGSNNTLDRYTAVSGWTGFKVYPENETAKIGASNGQGWLMTPALDASGTLTVVWSAYRYGTSDKNTLLLGVSENGTDFDEETITIGDEMTGYTNTFTVTGPTVYVRWKASGSSKARFYLDDVSITNPGGDTPAGDGIQTFTVPGTSHTFTNLTPETTYYARVKGTNDWSNTTNFTTLASGTAPSWSASFPATDTVAPGEESKIENVSAYASGSPSPTVALTSAASEGWTFENDTFSFTNATPGTYAFVFTASNVLGTADATFTVTVTAPPAPADPFEEWLADHSSSGHAAADTASNGYTYWENYVADIDPADPFLTLVPATDGTAYTIPAASSNRYYQLLYTTDLLGATATNNLGPGTTNALPAPVNGSLWFGTLRVFLSNPAP